jgi:hypothetical protein
MLKCENEWLIFVSIQNGAVQFAYCLGPVYTNMPGVNMKGWARVYHQCLNCKKTR